MVNDKTAQTWNIDTTVKAFAGHYDATENGCKQMARENFEAKKMLTARLAARHNPADGIVWNSETRRLSMNIDMPVEPNRVEFELELYRLFDGVDSRSNISSCLADIFFNNRISASSLNYIIDYWNKTTAGKVFAKIAAFDISAGNGGKILQSVLRDLGLWSDDSQFQAIYAQVATYLRPRNVSYVLHLGVSLPDFITMSTNSCYRVENNLNGVQYNGDYSQSPLSLAVDDVSMVGWLQDDDDEWRKPNRVLVNWAGNQIAVGRGYNDCLPSVTDDLMRKSITKILGYDGKQRNPNQSQLRKVSEFWFDLDGEYMTSFEQITFEHSRRIYVGVDSFTLPNGEQWHDAVGNNLDYDFVVFTCDICGRDFSDSDDLYSYELTDGRDILICRHCH